MENGTHNSERNNLTNYVLRFRVKNVEGKYAVLDQDEVLYGRYINESEALEALEGWVEYYKN